ncbi:hypothetical protein ABW19_dt0209470 [Dactylella cylindrospora]|nr:hypothetical protein ABW19_dt0209470 [Dactylella cylindrospora]
MQSEREEPDGIDFGSCTFDDDPIDPEDIEIDGGNTPPTRSDGAGTEFCMATRSRWIGDWGWVQATMGWPLPGTGSDAERMIFMDIRVLRNCDWWLLEGACNDIFNMIPQRCSLIGTLQGHLSYGGKWEDNCASYQIYYGPDIMVCDQWNPVTRACLHVRSSEVKDGIDD